MTLQISDSFLYDNDYYDVVSYMGGSTPFNPSSYELYPSSTSTASHRGYKCTFSLQNKELHLLKLDINLFEKSETDPWKDLKGPAISGVEPLLKDSISTFNNIYDFENNKIIWSGNILIAKDFIQSLYEHMGFTQAWKYEEVLDLHFLDGSLIEIKDKSAFYKKIRDNGGEWDLEVIKPKGL